MRANKHTTFFCFSPPVMIATCALELILAAYTLWRYRFTRLTRLMTSLLVLLAVFQWAEFQVCTGSGQGTFWSRAGYVAITLLPPIGIHIVTVLHRASARTAAVYMAYASALAFVLYFAMAADSLTGHTCLGNYVIFQVNPRLTPLYGAYYYGWVVIGAWLSAWYARQSSNTRQRQALYGFAAGYLVFLVPTTTANLLNRTTLNGVPSIMCGFAVLLAIIGALYVMPHAEVAQRRHGRRK